MDLLTQADRRLRNGIFKRDEGSAVMDQKYFKSFIVHLQ